MTDVVSHDKIKADLSRELEVVLKAAIASPYSTKEFIASEITLSICNIIEAVFIHGLKDAFFLKGSRYAKYPEPNFWPFVSKYSHKSIVSQIKGLNLIKTEIAKCRAWIRIVLNEGSLEHYVQLLLAEKRSVNQFYNEFAFLRDQEKVERMNGVLKGLSRLPIKAPTNSSLINNWSPSPLILAGITKGNAIKVGSLQILRKQTSQVVPTEIGTSALEAGQNAISVAQVRQYPHTRSRTISIKANLANESDDDRSSAYSHPSLLDKSDHPSRMLSSTPEYEVRLATPGTEDTAPLIVARRAKIVRNSSRSSSESNSKCSKDKDQPTATTVVEKDGEINVKEDNLRHQSGTADSGIDVDNRVVEENVLSPQSDFSTSEGCVVEVPHKINEEVPTCSTASDHETENKEEETNKTNVEEEEEEILYSHGSPSTSEHDDVFETEKNEEAETSLQEDHNSGGIAVPIALSVDSSFGKSLHDELSAVLDQSPLQPMAGNSLVGTGWNVARSNISESDNVMLSSSESTDSGGIVSFGQALRSALEQSPSVEERTVINSYSNATYPEEEADPLIEEDRIDKLLTTIPREVGLVAQEFRCPMCRKSIGSPFGFTSYGLCGVDGLAYCSECMRSGGSYSIPSRVLNSWDWTEREVSGSGKKFIEDHLERKTFNIMQLCPGLYKHCPSLNNIKMIRERLELVAMFLFNCRETVAEDFRKRLHPRDYLYNDIHIYSFMDLQNVRSGNLEKQLTTWLNFAINHVMTCVLCRQKGSFCEKCQKNEVIYSFNTVTTEKCSKCLALYHRECADKTCPKCERRSKYATRGEDLTELHFD